MKRTVYVLVREDGVPYSVNGAAAAQGFAYMGYDVHSFTRAELKTLNLTPETPVIGGMGTVKAALARLGVEPAHVSVPACLYPYTGRRVWRSDVGEVRATHPYPVFIKPYEDLKVFTGTVIDSEDALDALVASRPERAELPDRFPLLCQEPVRFKSEWRAFVLRGRVLGVSNYAGDPLVFPDSTVIKLAIAAYTGAPAGHSADFGVLDDGRTVLVEVNDGYALGCGGLLSSLYAELLRARWEELTAGSAQYIL
jgi:hypothetical protein